MRKDFDYFVVLYPCFGIKKTFRNKDNIFDYSKVKSYFIATFQGTHLNEVFKAIQGVCSLKVALEQNLGL